MLKLLWPSFDQVIDVDGETIHTDGPGFSSSVRFFTLDEATSTVVKAHCQYSLCMQHPKCV